MSFKRRTKIRFSQFGLLLFAVLFLEAIVFLEKINPTTLVAPTTIFQTLFELVITGEIVNDFYQTSISVIAAYILSCLTGIIAGWILWKEHIIKEVLEPYLLAYYAMPIFVFYPLLITIFGLSLVPIILIAFAMSVIIITINTANGFTEVNDVYVDVGRSLNLSKKDIFVYIYFPAATPYIFTGLKLGFIFALIGVVASEFILSDAGLGHIVAFSYENFRVAEMYAAMLLVIMIAVISHSILYKMESRLYSRRLSE